jgi:hypothetical protein
MADSVLTWQRGEKTVGSGRRIGTFNRRTQQVMELAEEYVPDAIAFLGRVLRDESQDAELRMAAADRLLDRFCGRPPRMLNAHLETDTGIPATPYLPWIPSDRLAAIATILAEARAAMARGEPPANGAVARLTPAIEGTVVDAPVDAAPVNEAAADVPGSEPA